MGLFIEHHGRSGELGTLQKLSQVSPRLVSIAQRNISASKDAALLENHFKAYESVDYSMDATGFTIGETKVDGMLVLFGTNLGEEVPWCEVGSLGQEARVHVPICTIPPYSS